MRQGVRLGIDVGTVRVGVARSDASGLLATPVGTLDRESALSQIVQLASEYGAIEVAVGLPLALSGRTTASTEDAHSFAAELAQALAVPVRLVDERLSTVTASSLMRQGGKSSKKQRRSIDQAAAVIILQHLLDAERSQGSAPGTVITAVGSDSD
jgi:putative Holliday junction resolvase